MSFWLYNVAFTAFLILLCPALPLLCLLRMRMLDGLRDRLAFYSGEVRGPLHGTRPVWIHAVSVGEVLSMKRLEQEIRARFPERKILVSSSTSTGVTTARKIGVGDATIFFPWDHPWIVGRAFRCFDPVLLILLETELWPTILRVAHRKGVPVVLLSGRISLRSLRRYRRLGWLFGPAVRQLSALGMQTQNDADRVASLGAEIGRISVTGSLKYSADPVPLPDRGNGKGSIRLVPLDESTERRVWVAGSTHQGEEALMLDVHDMLKRRFPELLLILAPRHPHRFLEVEKLLQSRKIAYVKRSQIDGRGFREADVLLLDTMGELPAFYAPAAAAFVGGSLVNAGGHNILEPARLCKPVFFGPFMNHFSDAAAEMEQRGGAVVVRTRDDLVREVSRVLADPAVAATMGELAHRVASGNQKVVARSIELVSRYLD